MAAALLQYQACLGIMVRLQVEDLTALKKDFDRVGVRGLSLTEFVSVMLDRVSAWDEDNAVQFIEDLVELFAQVDVNGDGTMEWEEFTSAIIEGGMGTTSDGADWRDMQYEEHTAFADVLNRPPKRVQYLHEFKRLLVHDNSRPVVEIIEPSTLFPAEGTTDETGRSGMVESAATTMDYTNSGGGGSATAAATFAPALTIANKFHPMCYIAGYRRDQDDVRSERSPVQALKYLSKVDLLAVSGGDLKLTFWPSSILTASSSSALETPSPLTIVHTPRPQRVLEWNPTTQHLYSISADLVITVWLVVREKLHDAKGKCQVSLFTTLKQHTDLLQDLLLLNPETLVTCGMDSMIYLWDTTTLQVKATRQGHRRGVRLLTKLSNQLFLSTGFECEVLGWDISALATTPVFKLWGHNAPVCCIQLIQSAAFATQSEHRAATQAQARGDEANDADGNSPSLSANPVVSLLADQAITVDDDGWFKWWNLADIMSMENNDLEQNSNRCLQTFRLGSDKYPWKAHSLAVLNNGQTLLAAGFHKLKLLQRVRLKPKILPSSAVLFNSVSFTFLTTTDREIRIWDATSGALLRTFRNITSSDISCVDLDARQRKIVLGTQRGELIVLNYMNGAILKTWTPHQLNVAALIYCREDQCVLTASWDRSLRLYDDNTQSNSLLRCITDAHDTDIKCMAYCYAMSLVATGSADGVIHIWDYIYFVLEDACSMATHGLPQADVTALEFVEPYPLLLSSHENGVVCCWKVSPSQASVLLFFYTPFLRDPLTNVLSNLPTAMDLEPDTEHRGGVSCCQVLYDESGGELLGGDIHKGRFLVVSASVDGEICIDDVSQVIAKSSLKAFRSESLPSNHFGSYNPRRRFIRHGKNAKRLKTHLKSRRTGMEGNESSSENADGSGATGYHQLTFDGEDVQQLAKWKAHHGVVRFLRLVEEPHTIVTCSSDKSVRLWSFQGESMGSLSSSQQQQPHAPSNNTAASGLPQVTANGAWTWQVDTATTAQLKREQAQELWTTMQEDKLQLLNLRRASMKATQRQRRRTTLGLSVSASAPTLRTTRSFSRKMPLTASQQINPSENVMPEATDRLFKQLKGEATWRQSDFQIARQAAWDKERDKFQQRMKRILKEKSKGGGSSSASAADENQPSPSHECSEVPSGALSFTGDFDPSSGVSGGLLDSGTNLLPEDLGSAVQELPFDDKDNWSVGGLNRQKQMYGNMHHEHVRRSHKVLVSNGSKLRKSQSMASIDLTPSAFLLERLGQSCVIQHTSDVLGPVKTTKKKKTAKTLAATSRLGSSQSLATLHPTNSSRSLSCCSATSSSVTEAIPAAESEDGPETHTQSIRSIRSAPALASQPTIKDLFLQQQLEDDKVHRASRLLTRSGSLAPHKLPSLPSLGEHRDTSNTTSVAIAGEEKSTVLRQKPSSAPRRKVSAGAASPTAKSHKSPSFKANDMAAKKLRIRSDTMLMRQEYFGTYSRDDVVNVYRTFSKIDKDGSGTITLRELVDGAGLFGSTHLRDNVMGIFSSIDKDQSGHIELKELCGAIFHDAPDDVMNDMMRFYGVLESAEKAKKAKKKQLTTEQLNELKQLFRLYDADRNGDIDVDELFNALRYNAKFYDGDSNDNNNESGKHGASIAHTGSAHITREDVERIVARFDSNTNSTLDLQEFIELFREEL